MNRLNFLSEKLRSTGGILEHEEYEERKRILDDQFLPSPESFQQGILRFNRDLSLHSRLNQIVHIRLSVKETSDLYGMDLISIELPQYPTRENCLGLFPECYRSLNIKVPWIFYLIWKCLNYSLSDLIDYEEMESFIVETKILAQN